MVYINFFISARSPIAHNVRVYAMWLNDIISLIIAPYGRGFS